MQKNAAKPRFNTYTIVSLGALVAIYLLLSRFLAINVGSFGRIQLGSCARILAGLWFGPLAGALCGIVSDLLGCLIQGYAVNPIITIAAALWGVIPALLVHSRRGSKKQTTIFLCLGTALACFLCTAVLTTAGLVLFNGLHLAAILPVRMIQFALETPVYCVVICLLYFSPITSQIRLRQPTHAQ